MEINELEKLRAIAEDLYVVLKNEIGPSSVTRAYEQYLDLFVKE